MQDFDIYALIVLFMIGLVILSSGLSMILS